MPFLFRLVKLPAQIPTEGDSGRLSIKLFALFIRLQEPGIPANHFTARVSHCDRSKAGLQYWNFSLSVGDQRFLGRLFHCGSKAGALRLRALRSADPNIFSRSVAALLSQNARHVPLV